MKFGQLSTLVTVVEAGGIRAAARKLGISQAAVTRALKELEGEAGVSLIVRGARGITLTGHGQNVYERARVMVEQMRRITGEIGRMRSEGEARIAFHVGMVIAMTILPDILTQFVARMPGIQVYVGEGNLDSALSKLRNGSLDFMIALTTERQLGREFIVQPILQTTYQIVAQKTHPLVNATSLRELINEQWVLTPDEEMLAGRSHHIFGRKGLNTPKAAIACETSAIGVPLVYGSQMVAAVAAPFMRLDYMRDRLAILPVEDELPDIIYSMVWRSDFPLSGAALFLQRLFHRSFPEWSWQEIPAGPA